MAANEPGQPELSRASTSFDLEVPASALAIGAHPDDVEFGCGATLAKWASRGCIVHHLVCTDGSKGTWDASIDVRALAVRRQSEQREAAARLSRRPVSGDGAVDPELPSVVFLGHVDGELDSSLDIRGEVARVIRTLRPDVILGHDPWKRYRLHPDHRHAGLLACEGIVAARDTHFFHDQNLAPHRPSTLLLWEADVVDHVESVGDFVDVKLHALEAHESQFESTMKATDEAEVEQFRHRIRTRLAGLGAPYDLAAAELFKRISDL